jgi:hypothetical protein
MIRHEHVLIAQAQQSASCNASHTVEARRGHITLLDVAQLEQAACECCESVKGHYERLLAV